MDLPEGSPWWGVLGATVTAGLGGAWALLTKRQELRASPPAAMVTADAGLTAALGGFVDQLGKSWARHTEALRDEIRELRHQLTAMEAKVDDCETHRAECDQAVADLRELVRQLEAGGPLPAWLPGLPRAEQQPKP